MKRAEKEAAASKEALCVVNFPLGRLNAAFAWLLWLLWGPLMVILTKLLLWYRSSKCNRGRRVQSVNVFFHGARDHLLVLRHILWWLLLKSFYFGTKTGKLGVESNTTWQKGHVAQARQNIGCWLPNHPTTQDCKEDPFDWKVFSSLTSSQRLLFSTKEMRIQRELSHKTESR